MIQKIQLQDHIFAVHSGEKKFSCEVCGKKFATKKNIKRHTARHSSGIEKDDKTLKTFLCYICGKNMSTKYAAEVHIRSHDGLKPHQCGFCDKTFTQKVVLTVSVKHNF